MTTTFALALLSIAMSAAAQFVLKTGVAAVRAGTGSGLMAMLANPWIIGGFALYGLGAVVWLQVLARWDVSKAYPMVGLGFLFTLLIGLCLGEQVGWQRAAGVLLIVGGVVLVSRS